MHTRADIATTRERVLQSLRRVGYICLAVCGSAFAQTTVDLDAGEEDLRVLGDNGSGFLGFSVASGDVNDDGLEDMILGAYGASPLGRTGAGTTYIVYGDAVTPASPLDLADGPAGGVDMVIFGAGANDQSGRSVFAADVDGDGIDDLIIGALLADSGVTFDNAVLDTLLLSAVVHPAQEPHTLDAVAERFGIQVVGRHTALGDAIVTAEILLRLIPLLAAKGIHTLGEAIEASQHTRYTGIEF